MADKGIIFSAPMVRALLAGRKTQTRRLVKFNPDLSDLTPTGELVNYYGDRRLGLRFYNTTLVQPIHFAPGDRLWVREAWRTSKVADELKPRMLVGPGYSRIWYEADDRDNCDQHGRLRPGMFMPRWASRLTLTVTGVRVERLQDISEADAEAEGAEYGYGEGAHISQRRMYELLWKSLHTKPGETWDDNPWVVAVSFDVAKGNIDG